MRIPLPIGTYQYPDPSVSSRKLLNCTAEAVPDAKSQILVKRMPGIDDFVVAGTAIRGGHVFKGDLYVVSGTSLFKITKLGIVSEIGTITGSKQVSMADNGFEMVIIDEPDGFTSDGATVSKITDPFFDAGGASDVEFIDGYFVFTRPDSQIMFNSGLFATTFNPLDFTTIDGSPDKLLGLIVDHREIFLAGETTCELWFNAGNPIGSPFSRSPSGFLEVGCASGKTLAKIDNTVFWLADDATVRRLIGNNPTVISTPGIAALIKSQDISEAFAFEYIFEEKFYYVLTFPNLTLEYDILANEWHNRESRDRTIWKPIDIVEFNGLTVLDSLSGNVGTLNSDTKTEWGETQLVQWIYQPVYVEGKRVFHDRLELNMSVGRGTTSGQGSDPEIILLISDDGGSTFNEYQRRKLGKLGERETRVFWTNLGSSYNRVYQCRMSDPVDVFMFDTNLDART
jgi:hypothetical protein